MAGCVGKQEEIGRQKDGWEAQIKTGRWVALGIVVGPHALVSSGYRRGLTEKQEQQNNEDNVASLQSAPSLLFPSIPEGQGSLRFSPRAGCVPQDASYVQEAWAAGLGMEGL